FRHHCRYRLTLVANFGHRQRVILDLGKGVGTDLNEGLGLLCYLWPGQRADYSGNSFSCRSVNADDPCVGVWRPDKSQIEHFPQLDVVGKLAPSPQQAIVFLAGKRLTHPVFLFSSGIQFGAPCRGSRLSLTLSANRRSTSGHSFYPAAPATRRPPTPERRRPGPHPAKPLWFLHPQE